MATKAETKPVPMVRLQDIADTLRMYLPAVRGAVVREGIAVETDWSGEEAIPAPDARRLVEALRETEQRHAELWSRFDAYLTDRLRRRAETSEKAYRDVLKARRSRDIRSFSGHGDHVTLGPTFYQVTSGETREEAREARAEALKRFDRKEPEPSFEQWREKEEG